MYRVGRIELPVMLCRLEMATKLQIQDCKNLYSFWKSRITDRLKRYFFMLF